MRKGRNNSGSPGLKYSLEVPENSYKLGRARGTQSHALAKHNHLSSSKPNVAKQQIDQPKPECLGSRKATCGQRLDLQGNSYPVTEALACLIRQLRLAGRVPPLPLKWQSIHSLKHHHRLLSTCRPSLVGYNHRPASLLRFFAAHHPLFSPFARTIIVYLLFWPASSRNFPKPTSDEGHPDTWSAALSPVPASFTLGCFPPDYSSGFLELSRILLS
jgi:hypothetical protein